MKPEADRAVHLQPAAAGTPEVTVTSCQTAPSDILAFWFPEKDKPDALEHQRLWDWRQRGGAHDEVVARFATLTQCAAAGELDAWAQSALGRLALILLLDTFARLVWAGNARAHAQEPRARELCLEGLANGHFDALPRVWHRAAFKLPLEQCECSNPAEHLAGLDTAIAIADRLTAQAPAELRALYARSAAQSRRHRAVIAQFGRYPHRNALLQREFTRAELAFVSSGDLPMPSAS